MITAEFAATTHTISQALLGRHLGEVGGIAYPDRV